MNDIITMFKVNHDSLDFAFIWNFCGYKILSADDCRYLFNQQISYSFLMNSTKDEIKYRMKDYSLFKNVTDGLNRTRKIDYLQFEDLSISFLLNFSEISQILQKFKNNGINKLALLLNQEGILQDFDFISGEEKVDLYGALNSSLAYLEKTPFDKLWNANIDDSEIINDKILFNALKDKLIVIIKKHKNPIPLFKLKTFMGIPTNRQLIFNKLTAKALTEKQIEFCSNGVKLHELSLKEFIASIKNKIRSTVFNLRLNGVSVKEIADKLEMTEGFVQNIEKQVLSMKSPLIEDKYAYFYETYKLSRSEFMQIFSESNLTYNYLEIAYVSGEKSISHLRNDSLITENQRDIVRAMVSEGFIVVNGERVRVSSEEIKKFLVETYATEEITFKEFINLHDEFLTIYDLKEGYDIFPMDLEDVREFVNSSNYILGSLNGKFRYFDIESINYKQFLEDINASVQ